jgi:hypothetical protein
MEKNRDEDFEEDLVEGIERLIQQIVDDCMRDEIDFTDEEFERLKQIWLAI